MRLRRWQKKILSISERRVRGESYGWREKGPSLSRFDWLDRVETMLSDEEKTLVERSKDWVYIDRLLSNEDKAMIEALLSF